MVFDISIGSDNRVAQSGSGSRAKQPVFACWFRRGSIKAAFTMAWPRFCVLD
jgi:hypothetical protein